MSGSGQGQGQTDKEVTYARDTGPLYTTTFVPVPFVWLTPVAAGV